MRIMTNNPYQEQIGQARQNNSSIVSTSKTVNATQDNKETLNVTGTLKVESSQKDKLTLSNQALKASEDNKERMVIAQDQRRWPVIYSAKGSSLKGHCANND